MIRDIRFPFLVFWVFLVFFCLIIFHFLSFSLPSLSLSFSPSPSLVSMRQSPCLHPHFVLLLPSSSPSAAAFFISPGPQRRPANQIGSPTQVLPQLVHRHHLLNWTSTMSACNWVGVQSSSSSSSTSADGGQTVVFVALPGRGLMGSIPSQSFDLLPSLQTLSLRSNQLCFE